MSNDNDYGIGFFSHGDKHDMTIDLECLANALRPYLSKPSPEKCECIGGTKRCDFFDKPKPDAERCKGTHGACDTCGQCLVCGMCSCKPKTSAEFCLGGPKCSCKPERDEVEERIERILKFGWALDYSELKDNLKDELYKLVALARKTEGK